ncbi:hypothetical protein ACIA8C_42890 [Nocardia sp. NPDC051321]|uniref:hypothetical protein n=1 Tax=Nocardia sp. NPDC051321 TaxID=3364323 RepID=UPI0037A09723
MSNTTFRRHYPEIVKALGEIRRTPAGEHKESTAAAEQARLVARNAKLRRDNQQLRCQIDLAAANLARLAIINHHLQHQLEEAHQITNITSRKPPA